MHSIHALRRLAANRMQQGLLPAKLPTNYYGGEGNGSECTVCRVLIEPTEMMIRIPTSKFESAPLHVQCYRAYDAAAEVLASGVADR